MNLLLQKLWNKFSLVFIIVGSIIIIVLVIILKNKLKVDTSGIENLDKALKDSIEKKNQELKILNEAIKLEQEQREKQKTEYEKTGKKIDAMSTDELIALAKKRRGL